VPRFVVYAQSRGPPVVAGLLDRAAAANLAAQRLYPGYFTSIRGSGIPAATGATKSRQIVLHAAEAPATLVHSRRPGGP